MNRNPENSDARFTRDNADGNQDRFVHSSRGYDMNQVFQQGQIPDEMHEWEAQNEHENVYDKDFKSSPNREANLSQASPLQTPREITLPIEAEDQLDVGIRIVRRSFRQKTTMLAEKLEQEESNNRELRSLIEGFERKVATLTGHLDDAEAKNEACIGEKQKLVEENLEYSKQIRKLQREVNKLKKFKIAILDKLTKEDLTEEKELAAEKMKSSEMSKSLIASLETDTRQENLRTVDRSDGLVNTGTGRREETEDWNLSDSKLDGTPTKEASFSRLGFLETVRERLPPQSFRSFLDSLNRLNTEQQSREETLMQVSEIFGDSNNDLYQHFIQLVTVERD